jgi:predicted enzyme related to lactoylglutathione lyase
MTEQRTYPNGVPCWIDTEQPDTDAACAFYGGLFGWTFSDAVPPGAPGSYLIAQRDGLDAAAIAPGTGGTPAWNTYVAVDDADRAATRVRELGGTVLAGPEDVGAAGRSATCADPQGARFRLWQPGRRLGAQVVNVPGAWNFSDLHTPDPAAAQAFYAALFGWELDAADESADMAAMWRRPGYGDHLESTTDPDIRTRQAQAPPGFADAIAWLKPVTGTEPAHWHVTFSVADRDDSVTTVQRLGGAVVGAPVDDAWTRRAVVRDPQGAEFTLSQFAPTDW